MMDALVLFGLFSDTLPNEDMGVKTVTLLAVSIIDIWGWMHGRERNEYVSEVR